MSDLGNDIRRYYESVVERHDPGSPPTRPKRGPNPVLRGIGVAVAAVLVVLILFGAIPLLFPGSSAPVGPADTVDTPPTTVGSTPETTAPPADSLGPTVFVTADGEEIASIEADGLVETSEPTQNLFDYVMRQLNNDPGFWPAGTEVRQALGLDPDGPTTGLTVELTIDTRAQDVVESVTSTWQSDPDTSIAAVVIDNETGHVIAAGPGSTPGGPFEPERRLPAASLAQVYTTIAALESGFTLGSRWDASSPQTFTAPDAGREWTVRNPSGQSYEPVILEEALYRAIDTVFAGVAVEIGGDPIIDAANRLGLTLTGIETLSPLDTSDAAGPPLESVATGAGEITTFDAAAMFSTLSREGRRTTPTLIQSITGPDGNPIYEAPTKDEVTVDPAVVEDIHRPLEIVPKRQGTGAQADIDIPQIGKTGTANNYTTAWYAGSTDRYTTAVSVSRPTPSGELTPLLEVEFRGQTYNRVFGGSVPAPIWAEIVQQLEQLP